MPDSSTNNSILNQYTGIEKLMTVIESSEKKYDVEKIERAYIYAKSLHEGQFRVSGEPYISHPIAVAEIATSLGLDTDSICAAFLHDTVEDCPDKTNIDIIRQRFGDDVAMLVDGLTKMKVINVEDKEEANMENIRKMLLAMSKDIRVIFIKLCDRLHNMRTLNVKIDSKRRTTALETMHVYAPLAHRLGMQRIKQELENLALQYLDPIGYKEVSNDIEKKYGLNQNFIENTRAYVSEKLSEYNIKFSLEGRVKTVYSIYRKMFNQNKSFDEIYDFYAIRIIVDTELECYTSLGIIHELFKSIPGRFKDYISTPKPNMYQSLHTTVIGRDGIPFEVQIRTREMHHIAEYGIAAHWKYKSGEKNSKEEIDQKLSWIAKLIDTEDGAIDSEDFMHALKIDIFSDETFVFTPKGDVIALPQGSTLIDFAYSIHSQIGNKMIGAKINGMIAPIDRSPQTGDIVEIITSSAAKGPSRDWLKIVKTSEARAKIRQWFKKEQRSENIRIGMAEIDRELSKYKVRPSEAQRNEILVATAHRLGMFEVDDLFNTLGYNGIAMTKVANKMRNEYERIVKPDDQLQITETDQIQTQKPKRIKSTGGVVVDGEYGCDVKYAKCCNPLPGDSIIGFITKGYGISIHKRDCPNVLESMKNPENIDRWLNTEWDIVAPSDQKSLYEVMLQIFAENDIMLLANITTALADMKVSLLSINTKRRTENDIIINLTVGCKNIEHFNSIMSRLKNINHVISIQRGFS